MMHPIRDTITLFIDSRTGLFSYDFKTSRVLERWVIVWEIMDKETVVMYLRDQVKVLSLLECFEIGQGILGTVISGPVNSSRIGFKSRRTLLYSLCRFLHMRVWCNTMMAFLTKWQAFYVSPTDALDAFYLQIVSWFDAYYKLSVGLMPFRNC